MGYAIIAGFAFLSISLFVGLIGFLIYLCYTPVKKRLLRAGKLTAARSRLINRLYILALLLFAISQTYFAFFPTTSFYKDEFKDNTGLKLPPSSRIVAKTSEYPDMHGDYSASAIIELDEPDYIKMKEDISRLPEFKIDTTMYKLGVTDGYRDIAKNVNEGDFGEVYYNITKEWFKIAFLKDNRTIIFERSSS